METLRPQADLAKFRDGDRISINNAPLPAPSLAVETHELHQALDHLFEETKELNEKLHSLLMAPTEEGHYGAQPMAAVPEAVARVRSAKERVQGMAVMLNAIRIALAV
jgi:hypothetical protein